MDNEEMIELARDLLTAMIAGLLAGTKMITKHDKLSINVSFSPQVFNPEYKNKKRKSLFIINACITPPGKEGNRD